MINEYCSVIQSPVGEVSIFANSSGVVAVSFMKPGNALLDENEFSSMAASQLTAYFQGTLQDFTFLQQQSGTFFQQSVLEALKTIPYGNTLSYAQLSEQLGIHWLFAPLPQLMAKMIWQW